MLQCTLACSGSTAVLSSLRPTVSKHPVANEQEISLPTWHLRKWHVPSWWITGLVLLLCVAQPLQACSCGDRPKAAKVLSSHAVFDGTVVSSRPFIDRSDDYWYVLEEWTFQVHRSWTQGVQGDVAIRAYPHNCGVWFENGERAIVVAVNRERRTLGAFKCAYPRENVDVLNADRL